MLFLKDAPITNTYKTDRKQLFLPFVQLLYQIFESKFHVNIKYKVKKSHQILNKIGLDRLGHSKNIIISYKGNVLYENLGNILNLNTKLFGYLPLKIANI